MLRKVCCLSLDQGCILIPIIGLATSGLMFGIHQDVWTILSLALSAVSGTFMLLGSIKYIRMAIIIYLFFEFIHITETFTACIIIFVDLIAFKNFNCSWNWNRKWVALCQSNEDCEDNKDVCDTVGILLGSAFWIYTLLNIYFLMCGFSLLMETHVGKSGHDAVITTKC